MRSIFLTGISGFLGKNIVLKLLEQKDIEIIGLVLPNEKNLEFYKKDNIHLIEGNILNKDDIERFLSYQSKGDKYLIHAAGMISVYKHRDPLVTKINVDGTKNVIDSCLNKNFKKVIYVSSVDSLPKAKGNDPISEPDSFDIKKVDGVYSKSKVLANNYVLEVAKKTDLNISIICPSAIMGPNDPFLAPINVAIKRFLNDKLPAITKGGYNIVDVRDVAEGTILALTKGRNKESYLLTGEYISVKDLIGLTAKVSNKKPINKKVPHFIIKIASPFIELHCKLRHKKPLFTGFSMDCLMQNSNYSNKKAQTELGYKARPIIDTLTDTINWMKESGYLDK